MAGTWLKMVGARDDPMPEHWLAGRPELRTEVGFSTRAQVDYEDDLVYYAIPQGRLIALAKVKSHPTWNGTLARWPWRSNVKLLLGIAEYERAPTLADIGVAASGRLLNLSVRQQSHIRLHWQEWKLAEAALKGLCDPAHGDFLAPGVVL